VLFVGSVTAVVEAIAQSCDVGAFVLVVTVERVSNTVSHRCSSTSSNERSSIANPTRVSHSAPKNRENVSEVTMKKALRETQTLRARWL